MEVLQIGGELHNGLRCCVRGELGILLVGWLANELVASSSDFGGSGGSGGI